MGSYINLGNVGFARNLKDKYIDKSGLIDLINDSIGSSHNLTCVSRPRRFGKSYAAQMLCAYYDCSCDSHELFNGLEISGMESYEEHINKYNVVYLDMTYIKPYCDSYNELVRFIQDKISEEISHYYTELDIKKELPETLLSLVKYTGRKIIMIIDEWDAPIRENPKIERTYLEFLRSLFKSSGTTAQIFAAAYMTGILPVKKDGSQSAISDFYEYTMINPGKFAKYVGFTEDEVRELCAENEISFDEMKHWYDGYSMDRVGSIYNPNSVMKAIYNEKFGTYWTETSAATSLMSFIGKEYSGMSKTVAELIAGIDVKVDTVGFANDLTTFRGRDDVLTLLIHLGYLAYDAEKETVRIPNEEVRREFAKAVRNIDNIETVNRLKDSDRLFMDTIEMNEEAVAAAIEKVHSEEMVPLHYNTEESLRAVIKLAYYTYKDNYIQWEELPSGIGYADIVYLPKNDSLYPALVIELKWNDSAEGAIEQIKNRRYPESLKGYGGEIYLIGISYDRNSKDKKHYCKIEKCTEVF